MRVLHVNAGLERGGGLSHIVNLLRQAKRAGEDFELLTLAEGPVAEAARSAGIKVTVLGAQSRYALGRLGQLVRFINAGNYQLVHTHGARANLFLALVHRRIAAHWVVTVHSNPLLDFKGRGLSGWLFTQLNLRALRQADSVLAVTNRFNQLLVKQVGLPAERVHTIYNGIFFHPSNQLLAKERHDYFNVINVARTERVKGQELLLRALASVKQPVIRLHVVGDGSELPHLRDFAQSLGLGPEVTFHGFLNQTQINHLYRRMDLAVLTSYSESFPLVLLEASDQLVPIMSTAVGDIEQMIPAPDHGFIAKVGDTASIAAQLRAAAETPRPELAAMAVRQKNYVMTHFSMANQLAAILKVYHQYD